MKNPAILFIRVPNERNYIRLIKNAIVECGIESYRYNTEIIDGKTIMEFDIFLHYYDLDFIFNRIDNIIKDNYGIFNLDLDNIKLDILYNANEIDFEYNLNIDNHIISKFKDIIVSDNPDIGYMYPIITNHINTFNTYELIKNNLLILSMINDQKYSNVLFVGKDHDLYRTISNDKYSFKFDSCDIYEFETFTSNNYDAVFINGYLDGNNVQDIIIRFRNSKCIVVSGILVPEYEKQYFYIIKDVIHCDKYKTIQSHYWKSYIIGNLNIDDYINTGGA